MRVLYLHERPGVSGGTVSLALSIEALGDRVEPWVLAPPGPAADMLGRVARLVRAPSAGLMHIWSGVYRGPRWSLLGLHAAALPRHLIAVRRILRAVQPDVVHVNDTPQLPSAFLAQALGYPVVVHLRAALPVGHGERRSAFVRRGVRRADAAVAINGDVADAYGWPHNVSVVPNPVRIPNGIRPAADVAKQALGLPLGRPTVGFVGPIYSEKGWLSLLEAFAQLTAGDSPATLAVVGEPLRPSTWHRSAAGRVLGALAQREDAGAELEAAIGRLALGDRVRVLGWRDDIDVVYAALDVLCAPSQGPELSRPVLEAQAHGVPVVAVSPFGGGIVEPEVTGVLVRRATPDLLADALRRLLADAGLRQRLADAARTHAEHQYAFDVVADRLMRVYERARAVHAAGR